MLPRLGITLFLLLGGCSSASPGPSNTDTSVSGQADIGTDTSEDTSEDITAEITAEITEDIPPEVIVDAGCHNDADCDDTNDCNGIETCDLSSGTCVPGEAPDIDDGIPCTVDSCDLNDGILHIPNDELCDGEGACTQGVCDPNQGCQTVPSVPCCGNSLVEEGESCDDGNDVGGDGCSSECQLTSLCDTGCTKSDDCDNGLKCEGWPQKVDGAYGQCVDMSGVDGENTPCDLDNPCGPGLACLGEYAWGGGGWCVQGWQANTFHSAQQVAIPDGDEAGVATHIVACGLATVPVDVVVTLTIDHPNPADLKVTVYDPQGGPDAPENGASFVLWDHTPDGETTVVAGFPGDDGVNGEWKLHVRDTVNGTAGMLKGWSIYLLSNFD
jgi:cysteine-rich repeat protein